MPNLKVLRNQYNHGLECWRMSLCLTWPSLCRTPMINSGEVVMALVGVWWWQWWDGPGQEAKTERNVYSSFPLPSLLEVEAFLGLVPEVTFSGQFTQKDWYERPKRHHCLTKYQLQKKKKKLKWLFILLSKLFQLIPIAQLKIKVVIYSYHHFLKRLPQQGEKKKPWLLL